jgi:hypothetical protein
MMRETMDIKECSGPQGDAFRSQGGHKPNATAELRNIPKEVFCRCLQQWQARWSKCVCVRARLLLWRWLGEHCLCPTITVQYYHSGNFWLPLVTSVTAVYFSILVNAEFYVDDLCYDHDRMFLQCRVIPTQFWNITFEFQHQAVIHKPMNYCR